MYTKDQIGNDGYPKNADVIFKEAYPPIPSDTTEFQNPEGYGYSKPEVFIGWEWSETFKRWGASVIFPGTTSSVFTWPKP